MSHVLILNGPIGVGKSTLGKAVAKCMNCGFIDSDDLRNREKGWLQDNYALSKRVVNRSENLLLDVSSIIIAKPLRKIDWQYFKLAFNKLKIQVFCITLNAKPESIFHKKRGRVFTNFEKSRCLEMINQDYGQRLFSDKVIYTDTQNFDETVQKIEAEFKALLKKNSDVF